MKIIYNNNLLRGKKDEPRGEDLHASTSLKKKKKEEKKTTQTYLYTENECMDFTKTPQNSLGFIIEKKT